ncbi:hypothetical protein I2483_12805 [Sporosarcina sp. E16_3]|uniref:hypothetical protein n=1 Tax=Sporosarcina sp. E16_3 TaxID=2789293 RepID=UPI001A935168|nr:hypothetical protein [Sporosarcina sp. E16_3]MBO0602539.1 hypothetical protein [Sporosarcina sp. E16_3]
MTRHIVLEFTIGTLEIIKKLKERGVTNISLIGYDHEVDKELVDDAAYLSMI